jgi:hypothetical protein
MKWSDYPAPHPQVAAQVVDDEALIVLTDAGEIFVLDPVGTRVWVLSDGTRTARRIAHEIAGEFEVTRVQARADVAEFLTTLAQERVVEFHTAPVADK